MRLRIILGLLLSTIAIVGLSRAAFAQSNTTNTSIVPIDNFDLTPKQNAALNSIRNLPTTQDLQIVKVDPKALTDPRAFALHQLMVRFVAKPTLDLKLTAARQRGDQRADWSGEINDFDPGTSVVVVNGDDVTASIQAFDGLYRIRPLGGGLHVYSKVDASKLPAEHPPSFVEKEKASTLKDALPLPPAPPTGGPPVTISVLVAYTPAVAQKVADVPGMVQLAIAETNQSYRNSSVNINMVAATGTPMQVNYVESGNMDTEVKDFAAMPNVQAARASSHANLVVLLVDDGSACGNADQIYATKQTAFAVVYYDCATGYYSFAHEIGHLQGARHNPEVDSGQTPFAYGHGFMDPVHKRRTIMSYDCPGGCQRMPEWARPVDWGNVAVSNDARVLNETATYIASFR